MWTWYNAGLNSSMNNWEANGKTDALTVMFFLYCISYIKSAVRPNIAQLLRTEWCSYSLKKKLLERKKKLWSLKVRVCLVCFVVCTFLREVSLVICKVCGSRVNCCRSRCRLHLFLSKNTNTHHSVHSFVIIIIPTSCNSHAGIQTTRTWTHSCVLLCIHTHIFYLSEVFH